GTLDEQLPMVLQSLTSGSSAKACSVLTGDEILTGYLATMCPVLSRRSAQELPEPDGPGGAGAGVSSDPPVQISKMSCPLLNSAESGLEPPGRSLRSPLSSINCVPEATTNSASPVGQVAVVFRSEELQFVGRAFAGITLMPWSVTFGPKSANTVQVLNPTTFWIIPPGPEVKYTVSPAAFRSRLLS